MEDNLSEILRRKRDQAQTVNLSCGNCKAIRPFSGQPPTCDVCGWVCTPATQQTKGQNVRAGYQKKVAKESRESSVATIFLVVLILALIAYWGNIKQVLGLDTATVQRIEKDKSTLHLYLDDGTVWEVGTEENWQSFYVLAGDKIRFQYTPRPESNAGGFDGEPCWLHDTTRPQTPIIASRVAGDPKRDSCPAQ